MEFRDLKKQYGILKNEIDAAMVEVAASGAYINGPSVKSLEQDLADYVGVKHCISCANGTDALAIALKIWELGENDAVFVPDFTFFASSETIAAEGATPVFVDVDTRTFNISSEDLKRKIEAVRSEGRLKPKAVVAVDLFGLPADYAPLRAIAEENNLLLLEDGAQGFGGSICGKKACSFGDIATTSFFPAKPLGCYGDGGAIFTNNDNWAALANSYKVHGKGSNKYDNVRIGLNSRLDTIQAAILQVKFKAFVKNELDDVNRAAKMYSELLGKCALDSEIKLPHIPEGFTSSWAQYTITLKTREKRDSLQAFLKERGIPSMVYYPIPMHLQSAFKNVKSFGECPVAQEHCSTVLSLPIHPYISEEEISTVVERIREYFKN